MKTSSIIVIAMLVIVILAAAYYFTTREAGDDYDRIEFIEPDGTVTTVYVEVADTPQAQQQGLMNRTSLGEYNGMLFVFDNDAPESFWMKDTPLPLDMVFVNGQMDVVDINRNATPYSLDPFTSRESCRYVVEVNGGFCDKYDIDIGDRMNILLKPSPSPYAVSE